MTASELRWLKKLMVMKLDELSEIEWSLFRQLTQKQLKEERKKFRQAKEKYEFDVGILEANQKEQ
jgi:hypothetical protein